MARKRLLLQRLPKFKQNYMYKTISITNVTQKYNEYCINKHDFVNETK
jgi:hypothetical protein